MDNHLWAYGCTDDATAEHMSYASLDHRLAPRLVAEAGHSGR